MERKDRLRYCYVEERRDGCTHIHWEQKSLLVASNRLWRNITFHISPLHERIVLYKSLAVLKWPSISEWENFLSYKLQLSLVCRKSHTGKGAWIATNTMKDNLLYWKFVTKIVTFVMLRTIHLVKNTDLCVLIYLVHEKTSEWNILGIIK
jgi:hypothetical protein